MLKALSNIVSTLVQSKPSDVILTSRDGRTVTAEDLSEVVAGLVELCSGDEDDDDEDA